MSLPEKRKSNEETLTSLQNLHQEFCRLYDDEGVLIGIQTEEIQVSNEFFAWVSRNQQIRSKRNGSWLQLTVTERNIEFSTLIPSREEKDATT